MSHYEIGNHAWRLLVVLFDTIKMYIIMSLGKDDVAVRNRKPCLETSRAGSVIEQVFATLELAYGDCISQVCV